MQLVVDPALVEKARTSAGLKGSYSVPAGFAALLAGSGLEAFRRGDGSYALRAVPVMSRGGEAQLAPVIVTANQSTPVGPDYGYVAKRSRGATRTDTPLIETPQAISVVTREQFRDRAAVNVTDALRDVAGATVTQGGFRDRDDYSLRGFTQSNFVLRDGLRQYTFQFMASEPWGLERIEVLKGPSSVLYGQLAPGGTVNLVSKRPTGESIREVEVGVGTNDAKRIAFDLGGRLGDESDWSWRLNGLTSESKDDIDFIDRKRTYVAPTLKWQPSPSTALTLLGVYQESTSGRPQGLPARGTVLSNINGSIPHTRNISEPNFGEQTFKQSQLGYLFEHQFANGVEFRQNLRVSNNKIDADNLFSGGLQADQRHLNRRVSVFDQEVDTIAIDSHLQKSFTTGQVQHTLIGGIDYFSYDFKGETLGGTAAPLDLFNPLYGTPVTVGARIWGDHTKSKQYGIYLQDQIKFDERWIVLAGLRHDSVKSDSRNLLTNAVTKIDSSKMTGRLGLLYLAPNGLAPYISYATSFVPVSGSTFAGKAFVPETGEQVELGIKYEPPGSDLSLNAAVYDLRRQNILTTDLNNPGFSVQDGEHQHRGLELEATGKIAKGLTVSASYTYIDGKVTKSNAGNQGARSTGAPEHAASLWLKYDIQSQDWQGWSLGAGAFYNGSVEVDAANNLTVPSFVTYDAAVYYRANQWRFALNVKNLADKRYIGNCWGLNGCHPGDRRSVNATASYSF